MSSKNVIFDKIMKTVYDEIQLMCFINIDIKWRPQKNIINFRYNQGNKPRMIMSFMTLIY